MACQGFYPLLQLGLALAVAFGDQIQKTGATVEPNFVRLEGHKEDTDNRESHQARPNISFASDSAHNAIASSCHENPSLYVSLCYGEA